MESENVNSQLRIEPERTKQTWRGKRAGNNSSRGNYRDRNYTRRHRREENPDSNVARSSYNEELAVFCCGICNAKLRQIICAKCLGPDTLEQSSDKLKNLLNQNEELKHEVEQLRAVIERDRERERNRRSSEADTTASALQDAISVKESDHKFEMKKLTHQIKKLHETVVQLEKENSELKSVSTSNNGRYDSNTRKPLLSSLSYNKFFSVNPYNLYRDLNQDIYHFMHELDDWQAKSESLYNTLITRLNLCVSQLFEGATLKLYGSYATKLHLPSSDIDLAICNAIGTNLEIVTKLESEIKGMEGISKTNLITGASVPLLKISFYINKMNINVDISVKDSKHRGLECCNYVKKILNIYKPIRSIVMVLKRLLYVCKFNEAYKGGLASYSLFLMVTSYLQMCSLESASEAVVGFLNYFGQEFNYLSPVQATDPDHFISPVYTEVRSI